MSPRNVRLSFFMTLVVVTLLVATVAADRTHPIQAMFFGFALGVDPLRTPIEPRNFNRYRDRRCDAAGVGRITMHDARRTCGSLLADLDADPRVAMHILRYASSRSR
jgi:hypothetical protein